MISVSLIAPIAALALLLQPAQPKAGDDAGKPAASAPEAPGLNAKLDALDQKIAAIKDLSADFEQSKKTALLKKPMTSSGTIRLKGQRTRWDTKKPHPTIMTIDAAEVRIYYPDQKTVEVYAIQGEMARLASSPLPRIGVIREQFDISEIRPTEIDAAADPKADLLAIALTPKSEALKEHVEKIRVLIDAATACAKRVEITDADQEQTTITFTNVKLDGGLSDKDVELFTSPGTTVSRPFEGGAPKPEGKK
jgi:outer membrane lipoprotein-sorting protein